MEKTTYEDYTPSLEDLKEWAEDEEEKMTEAQTKLDLLNDLTDEEIEEYAEDCARAYAKAMIGGKYDVELEKNGKTLLEERFWETNVSDDINLYLPKDEFFDMLSDDDKEMVKKEIIDEYDCDETDFTKYIDDYDFTDLHDDYKYEIADYLAPEIASGMVLESVKNDIEWAIADTTKKLEDAKAWYEKYQEDYQEAITRASSENELQ